MNLIRLYILIALSCFGCHATNLDVEWTIIGAGPSGIAVVGLLLDLGVHQNEICWIDPSFNVGRLGDYYGNVPGNAEAKFYVGFLNACSTFSQVHSAAIEALHNLDPEYACPLLNIIAPLQDITQYLKTKVRIIEGSLNALDYNGSAWHLATSTEDIVHTKNVVLATGSHPLTLDYPVKNQIPLDAALNHSQLAQLVSPEDTIAVVGSAHSAVLIMKFLTESPAGRIINFYRTPLLYPINMGTWELNTEKGLHGIAAEWAKNVLEKNMPGKLVRLYNSQEALDAWLPLCTKIIYAIGFERNQLPCPNGNCEIYANYDSTKGIIGPHLFGVGIAFPESRIDPTGNVEYRVGMYKFMEYIQANLPEWMKQKNPILGKFAEIFDITLL